MAHNEATQPGSYESDIAARLYDSYGPKVRFDVSPDDMGFDGVATYQFSAFTDNGDTHLEAFNESGTFHLLNDRGIEIVAGENGSDGDVDICITGLNGDIWITAMSNGTVKIKGQNVMIEAVEDVDIKAGRNVNITSGQGRIFLNSNKIDKKCISGNDSKEKSFSARAYKWTPVGDDFIAQAYGGGTFAGVLSGIVGG